MSIVAVRKERLEVVSDPDQLQVDPDGTGGVFGTVLEDFQENVEDNIPMYNREIDLQRYDGLSFERILEIFFDNIEVRSQAKHTLFGTSRTTSPRGKSPREMRNGVSKIFEIAFSTTQRSGKTL